MAISFAFSVENTVITVNSRAIEDWGAAEPPYSDVPIDQKRTLIRAQGGNAVVLERKNPGRRITLNLLPGSADSAYLHALYVSGDPITISRNQVGSMNAAIATEGVIVQEGENTRAGSTSISDDQYIIEVNDWDEVR